MQRTIRSNFLDSNKQEAIDMLLLGNAYSGELGRHSKAFLEKHHLSSESEAQSGTCLRLSLFQLPFHSARCCVIAGMISPSLRSCELPWVHGMSMVEREYAALPSGISH